MLLKPFFLLLCASSRVERVSCLTLQRSLWRLPTRQSAAHPLATPTISDKAISAKTKIPLIRRGRPGGGEDVFESQLRAVIQEQQDLLDACTKEARAALQSSQLLDSCLQSFVSSRGWDSLMRRLSVNSMRCELRGIMRRRRRLLELAAMREEQAAMHSRILHALEMQGGT